MPIVSMIFGAALIAVSLWSKSASDSTSITLWIPAMVGGLLALCGVIALKESLLKHAMHAAATLGLLGGIAAASRFVPKLIAGEVDWNNPAIASTGLMSLICFVFVGLCVNSFIQARRRRTAREAVLNS